MVAPVKRLSLQLVALFALAIIAVAIGKYASDMLLRGPTGTPFVDGPIAIAMNDSDVRSDMAWNKVTPITESKPFISGTVKGFINYSNSLVAVHVALRSPSVPPPDYNYYFIIDTNRSQVVDKTSFFDVMAGDDEISIPAGAAWYYDISHSVATNAEGWPYVNFSASYEPQDAVIYQTIVGSKGLERLRNTSIGMPLQNVDVSNDVLISNGTQPWGRGWNGSVTLPLVKTEDSRFTPSTIYRPDDDYYLVLINGETDRAVNVTLWVSLAGTVYY